MASTSVELTDDDMEKIATLDCDARFYNPKFLDMTYGWNFFPFFD